MAIISAAQARNMKYTGPAFAIDSQFVTENQSAIEDMFALIEKSILRSGQTHQNTCVEFLITVDSRDMPPQNIVTQYVNNIVFVRSPEDFDKDSMRLWSCQMRNVIIGELMAAGYDFDIRSIWHCSEYSGQGNEFTIRW